MQHRADCRRRRHVVAAAPKQVRELFQSLGHAFLRRVFADAERLTHFMKIFVLEEPQEHGVAVLFAQFHQRFVEHGRKRFQR